MTVRLSSIVFKIHKLITQCIDFTLAFPQTEVKAPIYLYISQGIDFGEEIHRTVLMLKKYLYGLKYAGKTWWEHLYIGLNELSFYSE